MVLSACAADCGAPTRCVGKGRDHAGILDERRWEGTKHPEGSKIKVLLGRVPSRGWGDSLCQASPGFWWLPQSSVLVHKCLARISTFMWPSPCLPILTSSPNVSVSVRIDPFPGTPFTLGWGPL